MLRTIPRRIMQNAANLKCPSVTDEYGEATYTTYQLEKVHIQPTHAIVKGKEDKSVRLNAVLFYDPRISTPLLDFQALQVEADEQNAQMKIQQGSLVYTVELVDLVPDDEGQLHHIELGLV